MVDIAVAQIAIHEYYVPSTLANDVALIRLERAAPYTDFIRPICLPIVVFRNRNFDDIKLIVAGFGKTENGT